MKKGKKTVARIENGLWSVPCPRGWTVRIKDIVYDREKGRAMLWCQYREEKPQIPAPKKAKK